MTELPYLESRGRPKLNALTQPPRAARVKASFASPTEQRLLDSPSKRAKSHLERKALNPLSPGESSHIERKEKERRAEALTLTAFPSHKRVKRGLRGSRRERGEKTVFNR